MMYNTMARPEVKRGRLWGLRDAAARKPESRLVSLAILGIISTLGLGSQSAWGGTLNLGSPARSFRRIPYHQLQRIDWNSKCRWLAHIV